MKKVLYVLHQKTSVAGDVGNKFRERGYLEEIVRPPLGDTLPTDLSTYSAIVIFGGPMSVNDDDQFIKDEIKWMENVNSLKPTANLKKFGPDVITKKWMSLLE